MQTQNDYFPCLYGEEALNQLQSEFRFITSKYSKTLNALALVDEQLTVNKAREYLRHGAMRRFKLIFTCTKNIFRIYPPDRTKPLSEESRMQICIELQAIYMNLFGLFENAAWAVNYEKGLNLEKHNIGLYRFDKNTKSRVANDLIFSSEFCKFLNSEAVHSWHHEHLKEYRDALAHRIPLYLPLESQYWQRCHNHLWH